MAQVTTGHLESVLFTAAADELTRMGVEIEEEESRSVFRNVSC